MHYRAGLFIWFLVFVGCANLNALYGHAKLFVLIYYIDAIQLHKPHTKNEETKLMLVCAFSSCSSVHLYINRDERINCFVWQFSHSLKLYKIKFINIII